MDQDLEDVLNDFWAKTPEKSVDFLRGKLLAMLIQELRELRKAKAN